MPRPGPRRALVNVRLEDGEIAWLDDEAARRQVSRSDVIRSAITIARGLRSQNRSQNTGI